MNMKDFFDRLEGLGNETPVRGIVTEQGYHDIVGFNPDEKNGVLYITASVPMEALLQGERTVFALKNKVLSLYWREGIREKVPPERVEIILGKEKRVIDSVMKDADGIYIIIIAKEAIL